MSYKVIDVENFFEKMKPNSKEFSARLKEMPKASVHRFCMETYDVGVDMLSRNFSFTHNILHTPFC